MFSLGALTFLTPWILATMAAVPVIWWLLRVMPPRPRQVRFPAFFLLQDLQADVRAAAHTPWWLLLLRALILSLFIFALADPVIKMSEGLPGGEGPVLVVVDNGFAAAAHWDKRMDKLREILPQLRRSDRAVILLPTAPAASDGKLHAIGPLEAGEAQDSLAQLGPQPWETDHKEAAALAQDIMARQKVSFTVFLSDGVTFSQGDTAALMDGLQSNSFGLRVVNAPDVNDPFILERVMEKPGDLSFRIQRLEDSIRPQDMALRAYAEDGAVIDELKFTFPAAEDELELKWDMLGELKSKAARFALREPVMASAVHLTDAQWQQHPVGILADTAQKDNESFLNEIYYLRRALEAGSTFEVDSTEALLQKPLSALIWADSAPLTAVERVSLLEWVEQGGFLIRFAGPNLAANPQDPLLPVALRHGQRAMEGSMTWEKPLKLGGMPDASPLLGLDVSADVTVTRQVLADPTPETFEKTWLQLEDGTPLITGARHGRGFIVLIHTTAGPDWSNFSYSGLFVQSLQRMISLSNGIADYKASELLQPVLVLDGAGRLQSPSRQSVAGAIDPKAEFVASPKTPPGIYGDKDNFQVFNLGESLGRMAPLPALSSGVQSDTYALTGEQSRKADLFKLAVLLLVVDLLVTLVLRGVISLPARAAAVAFAIWMMVPAPAQAAEDPSVVASKIYLAFMETGDQSTDQVSYNGLKNLASIISLRTTIKVAGVEGVNPEVDELFYYPVIYWPMTEAQGPLSVTAARNVQNYLSRGGMILFDTRDSQFGDAGGETIGARKLRQLTQNIQIPALMTVGDDHILTRSFYLLDDFPGLYAGGKLWVEKQPSPNYDAVTSVLVGSNDWAAAWSDDPSDLSRFTVTPGGERQREMAYRFGVNMVMVALTGNYKADQLHIPYILERIGK